MDAVAPSRQSSPQGAEAHMGDERRVGVIGLGIMGRRMIEHMARHERFAPARLFDPSEASREAAAALGAGT
ncbi:MAG: NAD(P)-binding domain-containing protein, partial [Pseudomonadota bacterium]